MTQALHTYTHGPRSGGKPTSLVVMLHGLGANGMDLIGLAQFWEQALPDTVFVSPDAPFPCDMAPVGHQWFSLREWTQESILHGVSGAEPILNEYISQMLQHYDLKEDRLALVGFSQGTMMSLYAGPRRTRKIAGILGYSGALAGAEGLNHPDVHKIPVHLIHGEADTVVPVEAWHHAKDILSKAGFPVTGHTTPALGHGIDDDGIRSGAEFLAKILA